MEDKTPVGNGKINKKTDKRVKIIKTLCFISVLFLLAHRKVIILRAIWR